MSKQLIRLQIVTLYKVTNTKLSDGDYQKTYTKVDDYKVIIQELMDDVSVEIYGADINRMLRVSSVNHSLENYLYTKINNTSDNISKYEIDINGHKYEIKNVRKNYVDSKRL